MNWDEMEISGNEKFCGKCRKEVFDLTNCSIDEVIALQRKNGPICGSIRVAKIAAVAVSLSAAACQNGTSERTTGMVPPHSGKSGGPFNGATTGRIEPPEKLEKTHQVTLSGTPLSPEHLEKMKGDAATKPIY
jgi:hypothetical protein